MSAGLARLIYWWEDSGTFRLAVESEAPKGFKMRRALVCVILGFIGLNCPRADAAEEHVHHDYYSVNGARLYVESIGQGTPVLFLHGGLMFFDNAYAKQIVFFATTHQVIGIDQRGHGHSPDGPWQLSYQMMADDTAAVLKKLKVGRVDVVGHSDGGNIALLLAHDHPELVRRMVVSGANLRGWSLEVMRANQKLSPTEIEEKVRRRAATLPAFFLEDYSAVSPDGRDHWMTLLTKCYWLWGQPVVIDPAELKIIQVPVMVVAGDRDFTTVEENAEIFRNLPHGELFLVPGTGHGTFQNRPDLLNLAVKEFLDRPNDESVAH
jgi:pimeloyl-ACP methyl ester carboxylesterase